MIEAGTAILQEAEGPGWLCFSKPVGQIVARSADEVEGALLHLAAATSAGAYAAGWVSYEAASGFDHVLVTRKPVERAPLLWFGLYREPERRAQLPAPGAQGFSFSKWNPALSPEAYAQRITRIRELIAAGDTYQVNLTFPLRAHFEGDPWALFHALHRAQRGRHHAFILTTHSAIVSASPELFFVQEGDRVATRPMKGTRPRGRWREEDEAIAAELRACPKERAENIMIVDLLRNDLSRVARPGSVRAEPLCEVETLETVLQMTSTIEAQTGGHPLDTMRALFPCGSVTGAPKIHTMKLIAQLEGAPRGVYTGAIGWLGPERRAAFSVAIRTVQIQRRSGAAVFGVGSGVTWDSSPAGEYDECLLKARILEKNSPAFDLIETMRWDPESGFALFDRHMERLAASAHYFRFEFDLAAIRARIHEWSAGLPGAPLRVRLRLARGGETHLESAPLGEGSFGRAAAAGPLRLGLAATPVDCASPFLFHKTTQREAYHRARAERPDCDDVILWNPRGELTESSLANLVVELDGRRWTPPRECGLLAGTMRAELLEQGEIAERTLTPGDLARATNVWLINSVRGWMPARVVDGSA